MPRGVVEDNEARLWTPTERAPNKGDHPYLLKRLNSSSTSSLLPVEVRDVGFASAGGDPISLADAVAASDERNRGGLPFSQKPVALVFGPENGAVSERLVFEAAREAHAKSYAHLYVIGFAVQSNARRLVEDCDEAIGVPATWVAATPDLTMGDLLKNMRSSQIFSVCGLPEVRLRKLAPTAGGAPRYQVPLPATAVARTEDLRWTGLDRLVVARCGAIPLVVPPKDYSRGG